MSTERRYDPKTVEPRWQAVWERERTWEVSNDADAGDFGKVTKQVPGANSTQKTDAKITIFVGRTQPQQSASPSPSASATTTTPPGGGGG